MPIGIDPGSISGVATDAYATVPSGWRLRITATPAPNQRLYRFILSSSHRSASYPHIDHRPVASTYIAINPLVVACATTASPIARR